MKALTVWQPWASLIMAGAKPYEFRRWCAPQALWGQRIVIHAGARKPSEQELFSLLQMVRIDPASTGLQADLAEPLLTQWWSELRLGVASLPLSHGLGTVLIGEPQPAADLVTGHVDSDRFAEQIWGWPLTQIESFEPPVPARGMQGFWTWPGSAS